jgi:hypothetical protein
MITILNKDGIEETLEGDRITPGAMESRCPDEIAVLLPTGP